MMHICIHLCIYTSVHEKCISAAWNTTLVDHLKSLKSCLFSCKGSAGSWTVFIHWMCVREGNEGRTCILLCVFTWKENTWATASFSNMRNLGKRVALGLKVRLHIMIVGKTTSWDVSKQTGRLAVMPNLCQREGYQKHFRSRLTLFLSSSNFYFLPLSEERSTSWPLTPIITMM